jgi:hypothetical protein
MQFGQLAVDMMNIDIIFYVMCIGHDAKLTVFYRYLFISQHSIGRNERVVKVTVVWWKTIQPMHAVAAGEIFIAGNADGISVYS